MSAHELADYGAIICGLLTGTGVLGISLIFGLYHLEDRLRKDDDQ